MTAPKLKENKRSWWWVWMLVGAGGCFLLSHPEIFTPIKNPIWNFLNSNFSTAFFGAIGGALTIMLIEWIRRQRQILADINTSIGLLTSLSNTLLNMKQQHTMPMLANYQSNMNEFQTVNVIRKYAAPSPEPVILNIPMYMKRFHCPELHFDLPTDRIFTLTDRVSDVVPIISQAKRSVGEVQSICQIWNDLIEEFKILPQEEKIPRYFGLRSAPDMMDTYFPDTINNVSKAVDDGLFFINLSIKALTKLGNKTLPFWLKDKIARSEITSKEHKALMPSDNHMEGWNVE
jgi:hypothetical protein